MFSACCFRLRTYVPQGLINGVLNETLVNSLNVLPFGCGFYIEVILPFSKTVFTLVCLSSLGYLICFYQCVCVCVCVHWSGFGFH